MATEKKETELPKMTAPQLRKEIEKLKAENEKLKNSCRCLLCDTLKPKDDFYVSTDPNNKTGRVTLCKNCINNIALRVDKNGEEHSPTRDSVCQALELMNKPFLERLWDSSVQESQNQTLGKKKDNPWTSYIKNVQMHQYNGLTWKSSDLFKEKVFYDDELTEKEKVERGSSTDTYENYINNKADVIRLLGYDPFEKEPLSDQPLLYSQLLGMLDSSEEGNDDMVRTASAISIVRGFLQSAKIDDAITKLMGDFGSIERNSSSIKSLQQSKKDITGMIKDLAAESCLSLKNNKNAKKGENTWTGKLKKIKDLNLREGEVNGFDMETCKAMKQVMDMSNRSIMEQLHLDESEWSDMVAEQREMIVSLQEKLDKYIEISRILLRENLDIKDTLKEKNIELDLHYVNLDQLFAQFSVAEEETQDA